MKAAAVLCVALVLCLGVAQADEFDDFVTKFGKAYPTAAETAVRRSVFFDNLKRVQLLNQEHKAAGGDAVFNVTLFMDLTPEEFQATHRNYVHKEVAGHGPTKNYASVTPAASVDWRTRGVVTAVKNQGQCGSCWAFSATETVESFWALAGNQLTDLSPQQVTSCTTTCDGCGGGWPYLAYEYLEQSGLESASAYPYNSGDGSTGPCNYNAGSVVAKVTGWNYVAQNGNEQNLKSAVTSDGPISVCVDASTWQYYTGGVLKSNCGQQLDHCVQLVGYTEGGAWLVRNSWTATWGMQGYIEIEMGQNLCGIANAATIVQV